jgi:hypothetical protein
MLSSNRRLFHSGHEFINVPKWVDEKVLQKYFVERHSKYRFKGHDIFSARFNQPFDKYPDLSCLLDDHREVPAEVEWKTSDFNHDINLLKDNDGFLIVYKKDENFELEQIEVDKEDFDRWYSNTAKSLLDESIKELAFEIEERDYPELWFHYLDKLSYRDFMDYSQDMGVWGVPGMVKTLRQINRFSVPF